MGVGRSPVGPPLQSHCALSSSPDSAEGLWAPKGGSRGMKVKGLEKIYSVPTNTI